MLNRQREAAKRQRRIQEAGAKKLSHPDNFKGGRNGKATVPPVASKKKTKSALVVEPSSRSLNMYSLSTLCASKQYQLATTDAYYDTL